MIIYWSNACFVMLFDLKIALFFRDVIDLGIDLEYCNDANRV